MQHSSRSSQSAITFDKGTFANSLIIQTVGVLVSKNAHIEDNIICVRGERSTGVKQLRIRSKIR